MTPPPKIFISTVTKELRSARELAARTLHFLGFDAVYQDEFGSPTGMVSSMLDTKLKECAAVIQIVGHRYGWDVQSAQNPSQAMSYTHYEAHYAHSKDVPIWYLVISDDFRVDHENDEDIVKRTLQRAYRIKVQKTPFIYYLVNDSRDVELTVFRMLPYLDKLRDANQRVVRAAEDTELPSPPAASLSGKQLAEQMQAFVSNYLPGALAEARQAGTVAPGVPATHAKGEEALYQRLAAILGVSPAAAQKQIETLAAKMKDDLNKPPLERARAAYTSKDYPQAEAIALEAATQAKRINPPDVAGQVAALGVAGQAASEMGKYARARDHYLAAATLTDRKRDTTDWARIQLGLAYALEDLGDLARAERVLQDLFKVSEKVFGKTHAVTLEARNNLGLVYFDQGKYRQAETMHRGVLATRRRVLGKEHPDTLRSWNNLALVLSRQGKHKSAEREHRKILDIRVRQGGADSTDSLQTRFNLANTLSRQRRYREAADEHFKVLEVRRAHLPPDHRLTLNSHCAWAVQLFCIGKHEQAENEHRTVLSSRERVMSPNHPDCMESLFELARVLHALDKSAEALPLVHRAADGFKRILGPKHEETLAALKLLKQLVKV